MLAGLQSQVDTLFPAIKSILPDSDTIQHGIDKQVSGRIVSLSKYDTETFDMHDPKELKAYNRRMLDLSTRVQLGTVRILVHDRQAMHRKDGSSGWFSYIEWMEFKRDSDDESKPKRAKESNNEH